MKERRSKNMTENDCGCRERERESYISNEKKCSFVQQSDAYKHFSENRGVNKNNFALLELGELLLSCEKFNSIEKMEMLYT